MRVAEVDDMLKQTSTFSHREGPHGAYINSENYIEKELLKQTKV